MNRRAFLATVAALPVVGKLLPAATAQAKQESGEWSDWNVWPDSRHRRFNIVASLRGVEDAALIHALYSRTPYQAALRHLDQPVHVLVNSVYFNLNTLTVQFEGEVDAESADRAIPRGP